MPCHRASKKLKGEVSILLQILHAWMAGSWQSRSSESSMSKGTVFVGSYFLVPQTNIYLYMSISLSAYRWRDTETSLFPKTISLKQLRQQSEELSVQQSMAYNLRVSIMRLWLHKQQQHSENTWTYIKYTYGWYVCAHEAMCMPVSLSELTWVRF